MFYKLQSPVILKSILHCNTSTEQGKESPHSPCFEVGIVFHQAKNPHELSTAFEVLEICDRWPKVKFLGEMLKISKTRSMHVHNSGGGIIANRASFTRLENL